MAADQFTAELESLCRIRREKGNIIRLIRDVRRVLVENCSKQHEGEMRHWVSQDVAKMYDDLERVSSVLDSSLGRYLEGPVIALPSGVSALPEAKPEVKMIKKYGVLMVEPPEVEDKRPIKGPGRRHGYLHSNLPKS